MHQTITKTTNFEPQRKKAELESEGFQKFTSPLKIYSIKDPYSP